MSTPLDGACVSFLEVGMSGSGDGPGACVSRRTCVPLGVDASSPLLGLTRSTFTWAGVSCAGQSAHARVFARACAVQGIRPGDVRRQPSAASGAFSGQGTIRADILFVRSLTTTFRRSSGGYTYPVNVWVVSIMLQGPIWTCIFWEFPLQG